MTKCKYTSQMQFYLAKRIEWFHNILKGMIYLTKFGFFLLYWLPHGFFTKEVIELLIFVIFDVVVVDVARFPKIGIFLINLMHHFLIHWVICFGGYLFVYTPVFFEKKLNFCFFSICSSFGRHLCQNCGWAGSEPYVRSHITEPPCLFNVIKNFSSDKSSIVSRFIHTQIVYIVRLIFWYSTRDLSEKNLAAITVSWRLKTKFIVSYIHWIFLWQIQAKYFTKFRFFHQKQHEISFFSPLWLNLKEVHTRLVN